MGNIKEKDYKGFDSLKVIIKLQVNQLRLFLPLDLDLKQLYLNSLLLRLYLLLY
jgi:hypothetical protein